MGNTLTRLLSPGFSASGAPGRRIGSRSSGNIRRSKATIPWSIALPTPYCDKNWATRTRRSEQEKAQPRASSLAWIVGAVALVGHAVARLLRPPRGLGRDRRQKRVTGLGVLRPWVTQ